MELKKKVLFLAALICVCALMVGSGYAGVAIYRAHFPGCASAIEGHQPCSPFDFASYTGELSEAAPPYSGMPRSGASGGLGHISSAPQKGRELPLPELFEGADPAVVAISTEVSGWNIFGQQISRPAAGSGFFVSPDGYIVTNAHVIENASTITVLLHDGSVKPAEVIGRDPESDIAVIKVDVTGWAYLAFGDSDAVRVGDKVAAIGNPLGELANSMTVGHISALNRNITVDGVTRAKLQTDAAVNRGNSGGPLINMRGEVVGVVSAKSAGSGVEGLGFAIPSNQAMRVADQLVQYGYVRGRAILGISVNEVFQADGRVLQVAAVSGGGAAERAGINAGDVILSANGAAISTFDGLRAVLDGLAPGDVLEVRVRRGYDEMVFSVTLDEYKPHPV